MIVERELPEFQRADAVSSIIYEANARIRDPVYGSTGAIYQLQKQVSELQAELAKTQVELFNMQRQQANLLSSVCLEMSQHQENMLQTPYEISNYFNDDGYLCNTTSWEPLWT
ncbi:unnamed protein product [Ilex paraguariensis]|uniref:LOB domain-containing protein n=1 Tax=Ilex paraguariensis TaxID=185542 RepID=A0ABC8QNM9_9AQUA